ncbi:hypothetical protein MMC07_002286 [Pseudocyphellaria aurata]|nr:hypothetical protein [Pseudocyphellaria aurata]
MATATPRRRSLARHRPSLGQTNINTASSPNLIASAATTPRAQFAAAQSIAPTSTVRAAFARKASLNQLTPGTLSTIPDGSVGYGLTPTPELRSSPLTMPPMTPATNRIVNGDKVGNSNLEVGDPVDVPGGMHGVVKFIGEVKGKKGIFAGVELNREWAARGKNDGDVEGTRYFSTTIPGAGIFLPSSKAYKRASPTISTESFPLTPTTPSLAAFNLGGRVGNANTPPTPSISKLSQSVGPGRAASPMFRPKSRPSLPRPESPLRKAQTVNSTPVARPPLGAPKLSKNGLGNSRYAPSPTPGKFGSSMRAGKNTSGMDTSKRFDQAHKPEAKGQARPSSRSQSRLGPESMFDEETDATPIGLARTTWGPQGSNKRSRPTSNQDNELQTLRRKLEERDNQLKEQTTSLAEMENSLVELQSAMPKHHSTSTRASRGSGIDELDAPHLRVLLREKLDKIVTLTAEFDAHRADFRSTIDTLELASTETERVYERRVEDLSQEIRELQDRGDDMESVALQLKQLEELVQELEEGLEDARRGEAEARGEVEFLRGEVERGRSELRREREKAAAALKGAGVVDGGISPNGSSREVEQRDDEIRGLKAIIHSLSRDAVPDMANGKNGSRRVSKQRNSIISQANGHDDQLADERHAREILEREVKELEGLVDRKTYREEELEHEIERLRSVVDAACKHASSDSNGVSERTIMPRKHSSGLDNKGIMNDWQEPSSETHRQPSHSEPMPEADAHSTVTDGSNLWCEICETGGHDILTCTNMFVSPSHQVPTRDLPRSSADSPRTGRDVVIEGLKNLAISPPKPQRRENGHAASPSPVSAANHRAATVITPSKTPEINVAEGEMAAGKASGVVDASKWCALCERDGHESVDCPFDEAY